MHGVILQCLFCHVLVQIKYTIYGALFEVCFCLVLYHHSVWLPPCSAGLLWPQPAGASPLSCHAPSGLQYREESIHPHAHGVVCACVCVWCCVCEYTCMFVCYMCMVYGCVYMCTSVCHCVSTFTMLDTSLQCMYMYQ